MARVIGVDPGVRGALAIWDGLHLICLALPIIAVRRGGKSRSEVDATAFSHLIDEEAKLLISAAYVEQVGAMPTDGPIQAFAFGKAYGVIIGVLAAHYIPITFVSPIRWRNRVGVLKGEKGDKAPSILRATECFPRHADYWSAKRGNGDAATRSGKAEAALIALHGWRETAMGAAA